MSNQKCSFRRVKITHYSRLFIVSELVVSGTQCTSLIFSSSVSGSVNILMWVFLEYFQWIQPIQWLNIFVIKRVRTCSLSCKTHIRDRILKLTPIHASVIYQIQWIHWIYWISVPFRENFLLPRTFQVMKTMMLRLNRLRCRSTSRCRSRPSCRKTP